MGSTYNRRPVAWTESEDQFLRENLHLSNKELAEKIGTTVPLIKSRLLTLKLRRDKTLIQTLPGEEWRDIQSMPPYKISSMGRVCNGVTMLEVVPTTESGYQRVTLRLAPTAQKTFRVHRLVAEAFLPRPDGDLEMLTVNHIDAVKTNNVPSNLEWLSHEDNIKVAWKDGLNDHHIGEAHINCNHSDETVHVICQWLQDGKTGREIADHFGVTTAFVSGIRRRDSRKTISVLYTW